MQICWDMEIRQRDRAKYGYHVSADTVKAGTSPYSLGETQSKSNREVGKTTFVQGTLNGKIQSALINYFSLVLPLSLALSLSSTYIHTHTFYDIRFNPRFT